MPKASTLATSSPATVTALRDVLGVQDVLGTVNIYDDTAAGIAATVDGDYFSVPSAEDDEYLILYKNVSEVATEQKRYPAAARVQEIGEVTDDLDANAFELLTSKNLYDPADKRSDTFLNGTTGGIGAAASWAVSGFIPVTVGLQYTISANANKRVGAAFYSTNASDGSGYVSGSYNAGTVNASTSLTLTAPSGAAYLVMNVKSNTIAEPSQIQVEQASAATAYEAYFAPRRVLLDAAAPGLSGRIEAMETLLPVATMPSVTLGNGTTSYIQCVRNGDTIRREFTAWPTQTLVASPVFNLTADKINGVSVKVMNDDATPYYALGETIGANHGYRLTDVTATAHGKTSADVGSVWSNSGTQYVLLAIKDANTLRMVVRTNNTNCTTGTYTHVSGATNTGDITATAVSGSQWYAATINRECTVSVDGVEITDLDASLGYQRSVVFRESYDVMTRQDAVDWFIANVGTTSVVASGAPAFSVSLAHEFDHEGNYTLYTDFIARADGIALNKLMFEQAQRITVSGDGSIVYYIPKALPFTHQGVDYDWAMIDSSDTSGWAAGQRADLTPARCEATGILCDRMAMLSNTYGYVFGLLPVQDAAIDTRRTQATVKAMQISDSAGKVYLSAVDKGDITLNAGDVFSVIAYRNVFKRPTGRTCAYPVRTQGADYFYVDWHDLATVDRVPVPVDFAGRDFEVVEKSDTVTLLSQSLTNVLLVNVDASGSYGYLILKVL